MSSTRSRKWPSYLSCVQGAPETGTRPAPTSALADFTWCMTAISSGHTIDETAARLMEETSKGRKRRGYALLTAQNVAANERGCGARRNTGRFFADMKRVAEGRGQSHSALRLL